MRQSDPGFCCGANSVSLLENSYADKLETGDLTKKSTTMANLMDFVHDPHTCSVHQPHGSVFQEVQHFTILSGMLRLVDHMQQSIRREHKDPERQATNNLNAGKQYLRGEHRRLRIFPRRHGGRRFVWDIVSQGRTLRLLFLVCGSAGRIATCLAGAVPLHPIRIGPRGVNENKGLRG